MKRRILGVLDVILLILIILFSIFMIYQVTKLILGGSWTTEDILISFNGIIITSLFVIAGFLISISKSVGRLEANFENLRASFSHLASDFKQHISAHN